MERALRRLCWLGAIALSASGIISCDALGIAHPVSNDGACAGNNSGACYNPGSCVGSATNPCHPVGAAVLSLVPDSANLAVGDGTSITATYAGNTLSGGTTGAIVPTTFSDSTILFGWAYGVTATAVGTASLTATYNGSQTTVMFTIHPNSRGASALILMSEAPLTGPVPVWVPAIAQVKVGWYVQFNAYINHNVTFDPVPGAPADIAAGTNDGGGVLRVFSTPGSYPYHCTIHGEAGVVNVTSQ